MKLPITDIQIGNRHRKDMGDIAALAANIKELGLFHPILLCPDHTLAAGQRRLEAVKLLGWTEVDVNVSETLDDLLKALKAERDENAFRKDLTPSEAVSLGKTLEKMERKAAKERQKAGTSADGQAGGRGKKKPSDNLSEGLTGRTREKIAEAVGMSGVNYVKAEVVVDAAEKDPEVVGPIVEEMDRTGKVDPAHKKVRELQEAGAVRGGKTLPTIKWLGEAFCDGPWFTLPEAVDVVSKRLADEQAEGRFQGANATPGNIKGSLNRPAKHGDTVRGTNYVIHKDGVSGDTIVWRIVSADKPHTLNGQGDTYGLPDLRRKVKEYCEKMEPTLRSIMDLLKANEARYSPANLASHAELIHRHTRELRQFIGLE